MSAKSRRISLNLYCIFVLPLCAYWIYHGVFLDDTWINIVLSNKVDSINENLHAKLESSRNQSRSKRKSEPLEADAIALSTTRLLDADSSSMYNNASGQQSYYLTSEWSLKTVHITVPEFHFTRTLSISKIPEDPVFAAALSLAGVYGALDTIQGGNSFIITLSSYILICICFSFLIATFFFLADCWTLRKKNHERLPHWSGSAGASVPLLERNLHPGQAVITHAEYIHREPLLLTGLVIMFAASMSAIAICTWITRVSQNSQLILYAIGSFIGHETIHWIIEHLSSQLKKGFYEFVGACVMLSITSCLCIFVDINRSRLHQTRRNVVELPMESDSAFTHDANLIDKPNTANNIVQ